MQLSRREYLGLLGASAALAAAPGGDADRERRMQLVARGQVRHVHTLGAVQRPGPA